MEKTKRCTKCETERPLSEFYKRTRSYNGLTSMCKGCIKARQNEYYQCGRGKEVVKAYRTTERGQEVQAHANARYEASEKGKATRQRYADKEREKSGRRRQRRAEQSLFGRQFRGKKERKEYRKLYGRYLWKTKREQRMANNAVNSAVRSGKMPPTRTLDCMECQKNGRKKQAEEYHHHKGYDKDHWLDVIPLCIRCHRILHIEMDR